MGCIFCDIVAKKKPARIVYEDEEILAFRDLNPQAPIHILIIPKKHVSGVTGLRDEDRRLVGLIHQAAVRIARAESVYQCGFRLVVNSGPDAGQAIDHLHFHFLAGRRLSWPPG